MVLSSHHIPSSYINICSARDLHTAIFHPTLLFTTRVPYTGLSLWLYLLQAQEEDAIHPNYATKWTPSTSHILEKGMFIHPTITTLSTELLQSKAQLSSHINMKHINQSSEHQTFLSFSYCTTLNTNLMEPFTKWTLWEHKLHFSRDLWIHLFRVFNP